MSTLVNDAHRRLARPTRPVIHPPTAQEAATLAQAWRTFRAAYPGRVIVVLVPERGRHFTPPEGLFDGVETIDLNGWPTSHYRDEIHQTPTGSRALAHEINRQLASAAP